MDIANITFSGIKILPPPPIYTFGTIPSSLNEGQSGIFNVITYNEVPDGTTLYWTINNSITASADFSASSGSFTINDRIGSFTITPVPDSLTEGSETFTVQLSTTSNGSPVATSSSVTVNDTSTTPPNLAVAVEMLLVGGGGGGGSCGSNGSGGGGGAGGLVYRSALSVTPSTTYDITVGAGGAGDPGGYGNKSSPNPASPGNLSSALGLVALNGGRGGSPGTLANGYGTSGMVLNGGSGGGGAGGGAKAGEGLQPQIVSGGYGNNGSPSKISSGGGAQAGQGGGGAGAAGTGGGAAPGVGGAGRSYSISGTARYYAGGGSAGGTNTDPTGGSATLGGGGAGGNRYNNGGNATYYGGGGGGAGSNYASPAKAGGSGYQGIVIIKYPDSFVAASTTGSPTYTVSGGYRTYTFTSSGTISF